jgi:hypothetical protein
MKDETLYALVVRLGFAGSRIREKLRQKLEI